jgi:hypothetical protein
MNVDDLLIRAAEGWRAEQPPAPAPLLKPRSRRPMLAVGASVTIVLGLAAVVTVTTHASRHEQPTSTRALIVRDGDTVEALGQVIATPGQPTVFCPDNYSYPLSLNGMPPSCAPDDVVVTGVDLDALAQRGVENGTITGWADLRGVYRHGTLAVSEQRAQTHTPSQAPIPYETPPCAAPAGGWTGHPDNNAIGDYLKAHADRFNYITGFVYSYPVNAKWDPVNIDYHEWVIVAGVSSGDPAQAQLELQSRFGPNVCAVPINLSAEQILTAEHAISPLAKDHANHIYLTATHAFQPVAIELTVLTDALYAALRPEALAAIQLDPWLRPANN